MFVLKRLGRKKGQRVICDLYPIRRASVKAEAASQGSSRCDRRMSEGGRDIEPPRRVSVEQRAAASLRRLIVSGELPEGAPLVQRDSAERLGISHTPIRHALAELERAGLVEVRDTGRTLVRRLTREDLEELSAARRGSKASPPALAHRRSAIASSNGCTSC